MKIFVLTFLIFSYIREDVVEKYAGTLALCFGGHSGIFAEELILEDSVFFLVRTFDDKICGAKNYISYTGIFTQRGDSIILMRPQQQSVMYKLDTLQFKYANVINESSAALQSFGFEVVSLPPIAEMIYKKSEDTLHKKLTGASLMIPLVRTVK